MTTKSIVLDVWEPNDVRVKVNQGEINARFLQIKITDKGKTLDLTGKTVIFYATKPDDNMIFNSCEIIDAQKGLVNLALTSQMSIVAGIMRDCEIDVLDAGKTKLKVKGIILEVCRTTDFETAVKSTSEFTVLDMTLEKAKEIMDAYSEENIMKKITSMDGEGSGLDADLLDGKHGSEYATAKQGQKADSAVQGITGNGVEIPPDSNNIVNITPNDIGAVPKSRRINNMPLSSDITLTPQSIGAAPENHGTHIPAPQTPNANVFLRNDNSWQTITPQDIGAATSTQGTKADSAIQGLRVNGVNLPPNTNQILDVETADLGAVPVTRKINNQSLFEDVKLTATDVGAATSAQGIKADTAIQGILLNGVEIKPSGGRIVDILTSDLSNATEEQWQKSETALQGIKGNGSMIPMDENNVVNVTPHIIGAVPVTRTINGKSLADDVTISTADFGGATAEQGAKADSAIQGVQGNGTTITPNSNKIVNITPSNIGAVPTSRTINSKDLSGNISLTATDVGAAPCEVKSLTDFNDMTTPGIYTMCSSSTNSPSGSYNGLIVLKSNDGNYVEQIAVKENSGQISVRYLSGSTWSEWKQIPFSSHTHPASDITSGTLSVSRGGTGATTAASALSNLGLTATATELNYVDGVTSNIQTQINTMKSNFQDGCEKIAEAITAEGISTATTASPQTMATNIGKIRNGGNATAANILSGKTAYSGRSYITGTMTDQGAKTLTPTGNNTATSGAGYYSSVTANGAIAYTAGRNSKTLQRKVLDFTYNQGYVNDVIGYQSFTVNNFALSECNLTLQTWAQGTPEAKTTTVSGASLSYNASNGYISCSYQYPTHYVSGSSTKMAAKASVGVKIVLYYAD